MKNEIDEIKKWEEKIKRGGSKYEVGKYKFDFQQYETIRYFGESIYTGKINIDEAERHQSNLLENIVKSNTKSKLKPKDGKDKKEILLIV